MPSNKQQLTDIINREIQAVLIMSNLPLIDIHPTATLYDLGLSSLDLATLLASLEMSLNADPFEEMIPITNIKSVNDLYKAYEQFLFGSTVENSTIYDNENELDKIKTRVHYRNNRRLRKKEINSKLSY